MSDTMLSNILTVIISISMLAGGIMSIVVAILLAQLLLGD